VAGRSRWHSSSSCRWEHLETGVVQRRLLQLRRYERKIMFHGAQWLCLVAATGVGRIRWRTCRLASSNSVRMAAEPRCCAMLTALPPSWLMAVSAISASAEAPGMF